MGRTVTLLLEIPLHLDLASLHRLAIPYLSRGQQPGNSHMLRLRPYYDHPEFYFIWMAFFVTLLNCFLSVIGPVILKERVSSKPSSAG
jgi:hypothetical protein